jgi:heat shock protein HslJ
MIMVKYTFYAFASLFFLFASCNSHKKHLADKSNSDTLSIAAPVIKKSAEVHNPFYSTNFQLNLFKDSVDFYGFNSMEKWELKIEKDKSFTFILNGDKIVFEFTKSQVAQVSGSIRYYSKKVISPDTIKNAKKSINITLSEQKYLETPSSIYLPFSVRIELQDSEKSIIFSGGGFYVVEPTIHDIWVLDSINSEKVDSKQFPHGLPTLEFKLEDGKLSGFTGCNYLNGNYYRVGKEIHFSEMALTMKSCVDVKGESEFVALLNKKRYYYFLKNGQLIFEHRDKSKLVFRKVD